MVTTWFLMAFGSRISQNMESSDGKVSFANVPTVIVVREELSKVRCRYLTFMCEKAAGWWGVPRRRMSQGESLSPDSGILATTPAQARKSAQLNASDRSPFLRTPRWYEVRKAMRACSYRRPYVFRTYFDTTLMRLPEQGTGKPRLPAVLDGLYG